MYLNILKKDLKRKRAMNIIILLFIILATMFVSSSVNNIINVTTALDSYFEMADVPDYFAVTMNRNLAVAIDETVSSANAVDRYATENILFLSADNFIYEDKDIVETNDLITLTKKKEVILIISGTGYLRVKKCYYFLDETIKKLAEKVSSYNRQFAR